MIILDFWTKTATYYEHPSVNYNKEVYIQVLEETNSIQKVKSFSSLRDLNENIENLLDAPQISVRGS
jgi:hypothetical protein